jgi:O-succinylbenzoate synthase
VSLPDGPVLDAIAGAVDEIEVRLVGLELRSPHFAAHGVVTERPTVIVRVTSECVDGWGECPALPDPSYTAEYAAAAFEVLRDRVIPAFFGRDRPSVVGHPMARGALADALLDLALRHEERGLTDALGSSRSVLPTRVVVTAPDLESLVARVGEEVERGVRFVGLKASRSDLYDRVHAVRSAFPELRLTVDGNGGLGGVDDGAWARLDKLGLDEVEQPCPPGDWLGSARVAGCLSCAVALDESIASVADVHTAAVLGAGRVVNLKPARVGGIRAALDVARAAEQRGFGVFVGGMLESGVGRAAALGLAASLPGDAPTHLQPSVAYWERDLTAPITGRPGTVDVPQGRGIGRVPEMATVKALTLDRCTMWM